MKKVAKKTKSNGEDKIPKSFDKKSKKTFYSKKESINRREQSKMMKKYKKFLAKEKKTNEKQNVEQKPVTSNKNSLNKKFKPNIDSNRKNKTQEIYKKKKEENELKKKVFLFIIFFFQIEIEI